MRDMTREGYVDARNWRYVAVAQILMHGIARSNESKIDVDAAPGHEEGQA